MSDDPTPEAVKAMNDLEERVNKFHCLQLPGQPQGMHMGTSYLVNDLWREVRRLRAEAEGWQTASGGWAAIGSGGHLIAVLPSREAASTWSDREGLQGPTLSVAAIEIRWRAAEEKEETP